MWDILTDIRVVSQFGGLGHDTARSYLIKCYGLVRIDEKLVCRAYGKTSL